MAGKQLKIMIIGLRGFPNVQGGIETHVENLCMELVKHDVSVEVVVRRRYMNKSMTEKTWNGVRFHYLPSPKSIGLEALIHTFLGVIYAAFKRPDLLHIHAIGPGLMTPLARLLGIRVVVTHHGPDYDRQKWGGLAKKVLELGELLACKFSNRVIAISKTIKGIVAEKHGIECSLIPNGVSLAELSQGSDRLKEFGLAKNRYVIIVSRLVPEKRHLDLIEAFKLANLDGWKLAIVGTSDHPNAYTQNVTETSKETENVVLTGFQTGLGLAELYTHAGLFVLPSSHEGLPIALLEALSYGLNVVASDIPSNMEVNLDEERYFELGNTRQLASRLKYWSERVPDRETRKTTREWVVTTYNWPEIARNTLNVYNSVVP
ncbi:glycosyltransferase family 4 protein [Verrucomicrobiales bacterium]|jgi:glycosyltransferase involved in cell wall biosynthesis|nr:glycosyltransferase family 4 protein [Verrucomicrobiales bacterium]MDB4359196.1 glycosyltransferase family 4 protein [Verrucomicrobiales bacterium]